MTSDQARLMAEALRHQMPNLKTQAQMTAFMVSFDSLRLLVDAICAGDKAREVQARDAFEKSIQAAREVTDLGNKFQEVPVEHRTSVSNPFTQPPVQFEEYDVQKRLLLELEAITTVAEMNEWTIRVKADTERVVTQSLRNSLFDAIRSKRIALGEK